MKKLLLLLTMSTIFLFSSAQNSFGIKAGVNLATMSLDEDDFTDGIDKALHPVITVSVLGQIELSYTANLTLELGLVQTGIKTSDDDDNYSSLTYNNVRFSPGIAFNASDEFSIGFGPYLSYLLNGKMKYHYDGDTDSETISADDIDDEMKLDYGLNVNFNYLINDAFLISTGYSLGLKDYNAEYDDGDRLTNSGIMISIGYLFGN